MCYNLTNSLLILLLILDTGIGNILRFIWTDVSYFSCYFICELQIIRLLCVTLQLNMLFVVMLAL